MCLRLACSTPLLPTPRLTPPSHSELSEGAKAGVGVALAAGVAALVAAVMVGWCWCVRVKRVSRPDRRTSTGGMSVRRKRFAGDGSFVELEERDGNGNGGGGSGSSSGDGLARKTLYAGDPRRGSTEKNVSTLTVEKIEKPTLVYSIV
jgi:uncharacterized membrane protein YgcG